MSHNLPKLPGYSFNELKMNFHVPQKLDYVNGIPIVKLDHRAVGGKYMDTEELNYVNTLDTSSQERLTYSNDGTKDYLPIYKPSWVRYDKKLLTFKGHFKDFPSASSNETIIRKVIVLYYLDDDTLTVIEPHIKNSGLLQGKLVKRGKIRKSANGDFWHWKDFRIGMDFQIFGMIVHITSCDEFTREFMKSQGIELLNDEDTHEAETQAYKKRQSKIEEKMTDLHNFLEDDGRMLQFDALWDDTNTEHGEIRNYKLLFFLYDKQIAIKEYLSKNCGRDPFPMLLRKMKVSKNWREKSVNFSLFKQEFETDENDFYKESDLLIGNTIDILGRKLFLYDCDDYTRSYYKNVLNIEQKEAIKFQQPEKKTRNVIIAPHIGIGDPNDTFLSCISFHSKSPNKDVVQYNLNANKDLRYLCEMLSIYPEDEGRKFVLSYHLATSLIRIDELPSMNSGLLAGRFSGPSKLLTPGGIDFYSPDMFYIGAIIIVKNRKLRIVGADLFVLHYMKENPDKFPSEVIENMKDYHLKRGNLNADEQENLVVTPQNIESTESESKILESNLALQKIRQQPIDEDQKWRPSELPTPIQELTCAQTLPENVEENKHKNQAIVCFTGAVPETRKGYELQQEKLSPNTHIDQDNENLDVLKPEILQKEFSKKVSFKNATNEK